MYGKSKKMLDFTNFEDSILSPLRQLHFSLKNWIL